MNTIYFHFCVKRFALVLLPILLLGLSNCVSLSFDSSENASWTGGKIKKSKGSVRIVSVSAEKSGEWPSLEKEIQSLLPLLFSEESYLVVSSPLKADYFAEVTVREREYADGWEIKRSLSVDVYLWVDGARTALPLSAGRSTLIGKQTLASAKTLGSMLRKAVKNAVKSLPPSSRAANSSFGSGV